MKIRLLAPDDDIYGVSRIYEESWKYAYKGIVPQDFLDGIPEGKWADSVDQPQRISLVMLDGDKMIGTSSVSRSRSADLPDHGEIISLYLLPEYTGKGHGNALLAAAKDQLYKMGFDKIFLWVLEENRRARHFYEKNGFSPDGKAMVSNIGGRELAEIRLITDRARG
ncbi:MAG: GNAT family N-acetyltransferase [Ruminococcus sp.]|nr:GNAT family N-acetyltransferase [Ruminococcus sp.]